jgi:FixJ family two-component response regulator
MAFECADDLLKANRRRVSCVIADVQMSGMTGLELYNRLVASGEPIPTILITAFPDERARQHALQAGVNCYLPKPFRGTSCSRAFVRFWERREVGGHGS